MSEEKKLTKQARFSARKQTQKIQFDFYMTDPVEKQIYEAWQSEKHKKQLFIKLYVEHLAKERQNAENPG